MTGAIERDELTKGLGAPAALPEHPSRASFEAKHSDGDEAPSMIQLAFFKLWRDGWDAAVEAAKPAPEPSFETNADVQLAEQCGAKVYSLEGEVCFFRAQFHQFVAAIRARSEVAKPAPDIEATALISKALSLMTDEARVARIQAAWDEPKPAPEPEPSAWMWEQYGMPYPEATKDEWFTEYGTEEPSGRYFPVRNAVPLFAKTKGNAVAWMWKHFDGWHVTCDRSIADDLSRETFVTPLFAAPARSEVAQPAPEAVEPLRASLLARLRRMRGDFLGDGINEGVRVSELIAALSHSAPETAPVEARESLIGVHDAAPPKSTLPLPVYYDRAAPVEAAPEIVGYVYNDALTDTFLTVHATPTINFGKPVYVVAPVEAGALTDEQITHIWLNTPMEEDSGAVAEDVIAFARAVIAALRGSASEEFSGDAKALSKAMGHPALTVVYNESIVDVLMREAARRLRGSASEGPTFPPDYKS